MSNVVRFNAPKNQDSAVRLSRLISAFAFMRRLPDDVFWLKENAELLGILATTNATPSPSALAPFCNFYDQIQDHMKFFPQYYRFLLSICLDLEDLGMPGDKGETLVRWIAREGLAEAELSDLQRGETRRLLARRGGVLTQDDGLETRLRQFIARSATFALPNKKAAYELTHIVFYLSEYGRKDPQLCDPAITSLNYAGLLAFLDQNTDLLAEICTALCFAGQEPSTIWQDAVTAAHEAIEPERDVSFAAGDDYHEYLVTGWACQVAGTAAFEAEIPDQPLRFTRRRAPQGALRPLSECLFELGAMRSKNWHSMRPKIIPYLCREGHQVLVQAETSTDQFGAFFESFARAGTC